MKEKSNIRRKFPLKYVERNWHLALVYFILRVVCVAKAGHSGGETRASKQWHETLRACRRVISHNAIILHKRLAMIRLFDPLTLATYVQRASHAT